MYLHVHIHLFMYIPIYIYICISIYIYICMYTYQVSGLRGSTYRGGEGEMSFSIFVSNIKISGNERTPHNQHSISVLHCLNQRSTWPPRSIHTFWYKGSVGNKETRQARKTDMFLKNNSPASKAGFWKKSLLGVWRLLLSRYVIVMNFQHLISNI